MADQPAQGRGARSAIGVLEDRRPAEHRREPFSAPRRAAPDRSHPAMAVNLDACIHCNLCVRACREVQVNDVIGMAGRGHTEKIVFDFDDPMGDSTCVACGECVQACPTGALMPVDAGGRQQCAHAICRSRGAQRVSRIAGSAVSSLITSRTTSCSTSAAGTVRRTRTGCASRAGSASTMCTIRIV